LRASLKSHTQVNKCLQRGGDMENSRNILFVVAAALTNDKGEILLQQRPMDAQMGGLWEFPGGKVDLGESPENALVRELEEELGIIVSAQDLVPETFAHGRVRPPRSMRPISSGLYRKTWRICLCRPPIILWSASCWAFKYS
jgi:8-oxo-dGTP pyrophosphatase MutT (NUDIX family)